MILMTADPELRKRDMEDLATLNPRNHLNRKPPRRTPKTCDGDAEDAPQFIAFGRWAVGPQFYLTGRLLRL